MVRKGLNVRQTETLCQAGNKKARSKKDKAKEAGKDTDTMAVEREMTALLGLAVSITFQEGTGGRLVIRYQSLEQLEDILERLSHKTGLERSDTPPPEMGIQPDVPAEGAADQETAGEPPAESPAESPEEPAPSEEDSGEATYSSMDLDFVEEEEEESPNGKTSGEEDAKTS